MFKDNVEKVFKKDNVEVKVFHVDHYEVGYRNSFWRFSSKDEAIEFAEKKLTELVEENKRKKDKNYQRIRANLWKADMIRKLREYLEERLRGVKAYKEYDECEKKIIKKEREVLKEIIKILKGIDNVELNISYEQYDLNTARHIVHPLDESERKSIMESYKPYYLFHETILLVQKE